MKKIICIALAFGILANVCAFAAADGEGAEEPEKTEVYSEGKISDSTIDTEQVRLSEYERDLIKSMQTEGLDDEALEKLTREDIIKLSGEKYQKCSAQDNKKLLKKLLSEDIQNYGDNNNILVNCSLFCDDCNSRLIYSKDKDTKLSNKDKKNHLKLLSELFNMCADNINPDKTTDYEKGMNDNPKSYMLFEYNIFDDDK